MGIHEGMFWQNVTYFHKMWRVMEQTGWFYTLLLYRRHLAQANPTTNEAHNLERVHGMDEETLE